jgi:hypothetical protein
MCWVTQSRLLDEVVSDESDGRPGSGADDEPNKSVADKVRTQLGLIHFTGPDLVVELRYSSSQVESADLSAPTFMDGCPSDFYLSSDRSDGWGRAICLDTVEVGLPEAVHRQILFDGTFEIRPIGYLAFENDSEQARGRFREKHNAEWEDDTLQAIWQLLTN